MIEKTNEKKEKLTYIHQFVFENILLISLNIFKLFFFLHGYTNLKHKYR